MLENELSELNDIMTQLREISREVERKVPQTHFVVLSPCHIGVLVSLLPASLLLYFEFLISS